MTDLLTPVLEGGIRSVNFFNGRLLSGEDLSQEKAANRDARRRLGRAIGDGIAYGLEVAESIGVSTIPRPVVTISPGLAVNRRGLAMMLSAKTDLALVRSLDGATSGSPTFDDCKPSDPGVYVAGEGVYLLVLCPATAKDGRAPVSGLGNIAATCNTRNTVECVQFRLIKIDVEKNNIDMGDLAHLRNRLAYKCFGVTDPNYTLSISDPFGTQVPGYGLLDDMRPNVLTDCDVPLALLLWTSTGGLNFIDMWAVRRRILPPSPDNSWLTPVSARRLSEGEAMFQQFQDQVTEMIRDTNNLSSLEAVSQFDFLPPLGILPLDDGSNARGINPDIFFKGSTVRGKFSTLEISTSQLPGSIPNGIYIQGAVFGDLIEQARRYPPIPLTSKSKEVFWLYLLRENIQPLQNTIGPQTQPAAVFVNGHVRYWANSRFDLAYWDFSNYAEDLAVIS